MVGSSSAARLHGVDRFYKPPAMLKQLQLQQQQQHQQRPAKPKPRVPREPENRAESDDSKPSVSTSTSSSSPAAAAAAASPTPPAAPTPNLDRFIESTTPLVPVQCPPKKNGRLHHAMPHFSLGDLWESFGEWSAYGAGVPLVLDGGDGVVQYYVPYLSAIQIYVDKARIGSRSRRPGEETDGESYQDTSSDTNSESEADRFLKERTQSLRNSSHMGQSGLLGDENKACNQQLPVFEYLEREQPYGREPLASKMSILTSKFPDLKTYKSCDLLPTSWMSVAWYPIYRIPTGPTLRDLDACFLTFHTLSTKSQNLSNGHSEIKGLCGTRSGHGLVDRISKLSLPVFGLASYKLRGTVWLSNGDYERQKTGSLLQAAEDWLQHLKVDHPDFRFFRNHSNTSWR